MRWKKLLWTRLGLVGIAGLLLLGSGNWAIAQTSPSSQKITQQTATITEAEVRAVLEQMLAASRNRDAEGILKFLAPTATIDLTVQSVAGSRRLSLTRQQYADYLKQGMAAIEQYQVKYTAQRVQVSPDGKTATAAYTLEENSRLKNQPIAISAVSKEVATFQRVEGQLQATSLRAIARVEIK